MRLGKHYSVIAAILALSSVTPALAQSSPTADQKRFELSALTVAKPQLSRTEIDPSAVGMGIPAGVPLAPKMAAMASPYQGNVQQQEFKPSGYGQEYNVDWSGWMTAQADKWYYSLRTTEHQIGIQFVTARPAMIQYTCYADGRIADLVLKQSSGVPAYDRLQIQTLLSTAPAAPFPAGSHRTSITLCQGWESHKKRAGDSEFQTGSFGQGFPAERVRQWFAGH